MQILLKRIHLKDISVIEVESLRDNLIALEYKNYREDFFITIVGFAPETRSVEMIFPVEKAQPKSDFVKTCTEKYILSKIERDACRILFLDIFSFKMLHDKNVKATIVEHLL